MEPLLSVLTATLDDSGTLIEANAGFLRLLNAATPLPVHQQAGPFFIQPDFPSLVAARADDQGEIHHGLMTVGAYMGPRHALRGRVWRDGSRLRVLAEYDVEGLDQLNDTVLELNGAYAGIQAELAQKNLKLQQITTLLTQQKAELEATLGRIKRLEGLVVICMSCKNIRNEHNDWQRLEQYISEHSDAVFSHGICPVCFERHAKSL